MNAVLALSLLAGGEPPSLIDEILPQTVMLQLRMLTLQQGMSEDEVWRRLGLKDRKPISLTGTITNTRVIYPIGTNHKLTIWYRTGERLTRGLQEAYLTKISP